MSNATTPRSVQNDADKLKQGVSDTAHAAGQMAQDLGHKAGEKAQDLTHKAGEKAQDLAHAAGQKVQDVAHAAGQKAEDATASLGGSLKTAAEKVRENAPQEGMLGRGAEAVANTLERGGDYLQEKNLHGMAEDITEMIKRNPIPAVLVGVGLGFLLGRILRS